MEKLSLRGTDLPRPGHSQRPLTDEVRRLLRVELIKDTCSATTTASRYAVSRRTLSRHLKAEGRTFRQVTNEVRCEIACMLLAKSALSLSEIAAILNYTEQSAFTRAFRRWAGQPPSAWRSSHQELTE